jgi:hypothetical protein
MKNYSEYLFEVCILYVFYIRCYDGLWVRLLQPQVRAYFLDYNVIRVPYCVPNVQTMCMDKIIEL